MVLFSSTVKKFMGKYSHFSIFKNMDSILIEIIILGEYTKVYLYFDNHFQPHFRKLEWRLISDKLETNYFFF